MDLPANENPEMVLDNTPEPSNCNGLAVSKNCALNCAMISNPNK